MHFDKAAYRFAKERIVKMIQDTHDWENTEGFIADGVICPDEYEKEPVRILCILAESYGYSEEGMVNIETQSVDDIMGLTNTAVQTPRKLATLLWLLLRSFEGGTKVTWEEFPDDLFQVNPENTALLQKTLSKIAWINVKKASQPDGTEMDPEEVYTHALRNKEILREQIQEIAPHLIIVCGEVVFRALHEAKLLGPEVVLARKWQIQEVKDGPWVLEVSHPSTWWGYEKLYKRFEEIYDQMQSRYKA